MGHTRITYLTLTTPFNKQKIRKDIYLTTKSNKLIEYRQYIAHNCIDNKKKRKSLPTYVGRLFYRAMIKLLCLATKTQLSDQVAVTLDVLLSYIIKESTTLTY